MRLHRTRQGGSREATSPARGRMGAGVLDITTGASTSPGSARVGMNNHTESPLGRPPLGRFPLASLEI